MLKHYLKLAIRNFRSRKLIFGSSLLTTVLGALCLSLLASYVINEFSMDEFHKKKDQIYMLTSQQSPGSEWNAGEIYSEFGFSIEDYPELDNMATVLKYPEEEIKLTYNNYTFSPEVLATDSSFFQVFDFELLVGDENTVLNDPEAVLFTEELAIRIFGDENPVGKKVKVTAESVKICTVKGIVKDIPANSSITFDCLFPKSRELFHKMSATFFHVNENFQRESFVRKIENIGQTTFYPERKLDVTALEEVYYSKGSSSRHIDIFSRYGDMKEIYILIGIMVLIFVISALNFTNLQLLNVNANIHHLGILKINGAKESNLGLQKIVELGLIVILSTLISSIIFWSVIPFFNDLTGVILTFPLGQVILINFIILVLFGLLTIVYPLIKVYKSPVICILKKQMFKGNERGGRDFVLTVQYSLAIILLISSIIISRQLDMMLQKELGFTSKNIVRLKILQEFAPTSSISYEEERAEAMAYMNKYEYVKNQLQSCPGLISFTQGYSPLEPYGSDWKLQGSNDDPTTQNRILVDPNYAETLGLNIIEGRFFDNQEDQLGERKVVINEAAKFFWGISNIGDRMLARSSRSDGYEIIGVVRDFNYQHLSVKPQPLVLTLNNQPKTNFLIRVNENSIDASLQFIRQLFEEINQGEAFQYAFLSDDIEQLYQNEKQLSTIYILFTVVALLITTTGLFAIALFDTQLRTKEIGIRKVNGAKIFEILTMLNKDFVKWVAVAFVIATPIVWYAMNKWLENFAYKTNLSWWIFALAGLLALGIALLTVSFQSWKAANRNPVESLRYE